MQQRKNYGLVTQGENGKIRNVFLFLIIYNLFNHLKVSASFPNFKCFLA